MRNGTIGRRGLLLGGLGVAVGRNAWAAKACYDSSVPNERFFANKYSEVSENPRQLCEGCMYFRGKKGAMCGDCSELKGSVNRKGSCESWARPD